VDAALMRKCRTHWKRIAAVAVHDCPAFDDQALFEIINQPQAPSAATSAATTLLHLRFTACPLLSAAAIEALSALRELQTLIIGPSVYHFSAAQLHALFSSQPALRSLHLEHFSFFPNSPLPYLRAAQQLHTLVLNAYTAIDSTDVFNLARHLRLLECFRLRARRHVRSSAIGALVAANCGLRILDVQVTDIGDSLISAIAAANTAALQQLALEPCSAVSEAAFDALFQPQRDWSELRSLSLIGAPALVARHLLSLEAPLLTHVNLNSCGAPSDSELSVFLLLHGDTLREVELQRTAAAGQTVAALTEMQAQRRHSGRPSLLDVNLLHSLAPSPIPGSILSALLLRCSLRALHLDASAAVTDDLFAAACPSFACLQVLRCPAASAFSSALSDGALFALAAAAPPLRCVDLSHHPRMSDDGATALVAACSKNLTTLILNGLPLLTDKFVVSLATHAAQLRHVELEQDGGKISLSAIRRLQLRFIPQTAHTNSSASAAAAVYRMFACNPTSNAQHASGPSAQSLLTVVCSHK
jgi:hypothetical protein